MPGIRHRRKGPLPFRYVFIITFIIFILFTFQGLWLINKGIEPTLMDIAEAETKKLANIAINDAVSKRIAEGIDTDQLVTVTTNEDGTIMGVGWNSAEVNRLLAQITARVQQNIKKIEEGDTDDFNYPANVEVEREDEQTGIIKKIPLGQATNNALLANLGPVVPVRLSAVGSVQSNVEKNVVPYGINNTLIEILVHVEVELQVVIPFETKVSYVETSLPVDIRVIQGEVPYFYNNGGGDVSPAIMPPVK